MATKKISVKKQLVAAPVSADAVIETPLKPAKKAPARKRAVKAPAAAAAVERPLDQDVKPQTQPAIALDYPQKGEAVMSDHYTLRLTVPEGAAFVEVSIDDGAWQPCRFSVGHWWYDWSGYEAGRHTLRARTLGADGLEASVKRQVTVAIAA